MKEGHKQILMIMITVLGIVGMVVFGGWGLCASIFFLVWGSNFALQRVYRENMARMYEKGWRNALELEKDIRMKHEESEKHRKASFSNKRSKEERRKSRSLYLQADAELKTLNGIRSKYF